MMTIAPSVANPPRIDTTEARWAADQVASLVRRVGVDSVTGMVLAQAERELRSLAPEPVEVIGPLRLRVA